MDRILLMKELAEKMGIWSQVQEAVLRMTCEVFDEDIDTTTCDDSSNIEYHKNIC